MRGRRLVRLDDIQPAKVKSLDEVRDDIAAKVKHEKALDAYYALQQKVSDAASNDTESLAGAEQAAGVKATQTGWFPPPLRAEIISADFSLANAAKSPPLFSSSSTAFASSSVLVWMML